MKNQPEESNWNIPTATKGMSEPNVTRIVELADPKNHAIEPKITTLSYMQQELWQFKDFPIETMLFFSNFHQNSVKYEILFL